MRRAVLLVAAAVLLGGPTLLAFFAGGFFDGPRFVATLVAWVLVLVVALTSTRPLPRSAPGLAALAGLALITAWTGASLAWAPLSEPATDNLVRLLLYLGVFIAAGALLRDRAASRAVEPALALGAVVVIGYGLAGRLLPGLVEQSESALAFGRLEQPITYWNAEGALAAMALVLCTRLAGTETRPPALRVVAAAACAPLGMGVYLSYSRGAIAAALVGLIVLLAAVPTRRQLRATAVALTATLLAAIASASFSGVAARVGHMGRQETEGAAVLAILIAVSAAAGWAQLRAFRAEGRQGDGPGSWRSRGTCALPPLSPSGFALPDSWPRVWSKTARRASCRGRLGYRDSRRPTPGATTTGGSVSRRSPTTRSGVWVAAASVRSGCASGRFGRPPAKSTRSRSRWRPSWVSRGYSVSDCSWAGSRLRLAEPFGAAPRLRRGRWQHLPFGGSMRRSIGTGRCPL